MRTFIRENKRILKCLLIVYVVFIILSIIMFSLSKTNIQKGELYMGVVNNGVSESLDKDAAYRQYFYSERTCTGIEILMATYGQTAKNDMLVYMYDANTDQLLGEHEISKEDIMDNQYAKVYFDDYVLKEGGYYYFEVALKDKAESPVALWLGVPGKSVYCGELKVKDTTVENSAVVFRLLFDYESKWIVTWMFLIVFLLIFTVYAVEKQKTKLRKE